MDTKQNNPIKEIILNISFDNKLALDKLQDFCKSETISNDFPFVDEGYDAKLRLKNAPKSEFSQSGFILRSTGDKKNFLNVKLGKISYHIVDRYEDYGFIIERMSLYWDILQQIFGRILVTNISVRYINQIKLLNGAKQGEYINIITNTPWKNIESNFLNFSIKPDETDQDIKSNIIIASNNQNLIIDISVEKLLKKEYLPNFQESFMLLRPIKNQVFQSLISEKTKKMFE